MASITATALKTTLEGGTYPYTLRFRTTEPKYPIYPYVLIRKSKPQGTDEDHVTVTKRDGFEITLFVRYTRDQEKEEADQTTIENAILVLLEAQNFGASHLFTESKNWQRQPMQRMYGSQSRIIINITDIISKSGSGIIGANDKIELNAPSGTLIQVLRLSDNRGTSVDSHMTDDGKSWWDPTSSEVHSIDFTYESTTALDTTINTAADARNEIQGRLQRGGVTTNYTFLVGKTTKAGQFDNIERATTTLYVTGTWS
jgi:hypothetical protein